jgi:DMSO reductase family type II enzyme molybdopterin subunit
VTKYPNRNSEEAYRQRWKWDAVAWGTHCVDCIPGTCPYRVYLKDGKVAWEEAAARYEPIEPGIPDWNPMGCQKGASWGQMLHAPERVLYPLKRAGERGEGKWERISWDEALSAVADAILDAIEELGPESIVHEMTGGQGGMLALGPCMAFIRSLGGVSLDLNAVVNDFTPGKYLTFGKYFAGTMDDWFLSELLFIWHMNPAYTRIPFYHWVSEARYHGVEVVTVAPDFSPSAVHADYHVPVRPGADAALALGMCQTIVAEKLYNAAFVREQTDLPLLVRVDNRRFLRQSDLKGGGSDEQFYFWDAKGQELVEAPRGTLDLQGREPALEGRYRARLADGRQVQVVPAFELVKERLVDYEPEKSAQMCGIHPEVMRLLARKTAQKRTNILLGFNSCKSYHGDLMERSLCLLLALSGNWGRKGTGIRIWTGGPTPVTALLGLKPKAGTEATLQLQQAQVQIIKAMKAQDPTLTDELAVIQLASNLAPQVNFTPPVFFWYYHCGYRENWNKREWHDRSMARSFDEYMKEALDKGWWQGLVRPAEKTPPRVYFEVGGNTLRRTRGGQTMLLRHLWPKLKMVVNIDWRMNSTGTYADIFLPAATHSEKINFWGPNSDTVQFVLNDRAVAPAGEAKPEWEIFILLAQKLAERGKARGLIEYSDGQGSTRRLDSIYGLLTAGGEITEDEQWVDEWLQDSAATGILPQGTNLATLREKGFVRFIDWGLSPMGLSQASDLRGDEVVSTLRYHTEKKRPYPTLTRRAQFYIDHDWFLEAGEELPVHKDTPKMGGDYPLVLSSGHPRWSIHAANVANSLMLQGHRGRPHLFMNPSDAQARGIRDGGEVRVHNDMSSIVVAAKLSPAVQPGQVIMYNGWEPYQFKEWKDAACLEPGMVKWLHLAGGYGHLRYWPMEWQPCQMDRSVRVDIAKVDG